MPDFNEVYMKTKHYTVGHRDITHACIHSLTHDLEESTLDGKGRMKRAFKDEKAGIDFMVQNPYKVSCDFIVTGAGDLIHFEPDSPTLLPEDVMFHHCRGYNSHTVGFEVFRNGNKALDKQYELEQYRTLARILSMWGLPFFYHWQVNEEKTDPDYFNEDLFLSLITSDKVINDVP